MKRRIFDIIQIGQKGDFASRAFDLGIVIVILVNIATMILQTFDELASYQNVFVVAETVTIVLFIAEYILRLWTAEYLYPTSHRAKAVLRFMISFDGIIELFTILPFFFMSGFVAFRLLRVVRIFHLFRINSYTDSFHVIKSVLYEKRNQLVSSIFIIVVLMFASSLFMYSAEHSAQPQAFKNAFSGLWWSMSTLLTVGYGDIYPITAIGRIMAIFIAFLGVGVVAIPTGIISAGFVEQYRKEQDSTNNDLQRIHTIIIDIDSQWLGHTVAEIEQQYPVNILLRQKGKYAIKADSNDVVSLEDVLTVYQYEEPHIQKKSQS